MDTARTSLPQILQILVPLLLSGVFFQIQNTAILVQLWLLSLSSIKGMGLQERLQLETYWCLRGSRGVNRRTMIGLYMKIADELS